jgi:DNA polymerase III sliding clamp (beta) subunit (PCNA family)
MPRGGDVSDFPGRPLLRPWEARAVVPAFYFDEVCGRILTASSKDPTRPSLHGVLLDFTMAPDRTVTCVAVGSDGCRMHILNLPQMKIQPRGHVTPPSVVVHEHFFRYLQTVANREWTALEISEHQISARGEDYQAVATATMKGETALRGLENWRSVNVDHRGYWAVDHKELERVLRKIVDSDDLDEKIDLFIDASKDQLVISPYKDRGRQGGEGVSIRRFDGPAMVDVQINANFLLAGAAACKSGLIRLGFAAAKDQKSAPVTIRGEDDQFKAIVMPLG